jgi:hypothetical protein
MVINLQTHGPLLPVDARVANDLHAIALQSSPAIRQIMVFWFLPGRTRHLDDWIDPGPVFSIQALLGGISYGRHRLGRRGGDLAGALAVLRSRPAGL